MNTGSLEKDVLPDKRLHDRARFKEWVEIQVGQIPSIARTHDISISGACLRIANGFLPAAGDSLDVTLIDGTHRNGLVHWQFGQLLGVEFNRPIETPCQWMDPEFLGRDYFEALRRMHLMNR